MLDVHGQPLRSSEVERLIQALRDDGRPAAVEAAGTILHAFVNDRFDAAYLNFVTREAVFFVLTAENELPEGLVKLRKALRRRAVLLA